MGQHVVVHVNGGAVVDGVAQPLSENGLARVRGKAEQKEAGLSCREAIDRLKETSREILLLYFYKLGCKRVLSCGQVSSC